MQQIVSIITPSFNRANLINETAESIFNQTYPYWEWVIVDDGSTDNSWEIIEQFAAKDSRVKIYKRDKIPKGACTCRNIGVDKCAGEYLIFLDTDDLLEPFCLQQRVSSMQSNEELDFSIFPSLMFRHEPFDLNLWWNIDKPQTELIRQFYQDAICQGTGVIWKKESFNKIGQWNQNLMLWQDIDLFLRAFIQQYKYKKFFNLPPDLHNRRLENSLSRGNFLAIEKQESRVIVIKRAIELLNINKMQALKSETRYMLAEIISGFIRSNYFNHAKKMILWGSEEKVFTTDDAKKLNLANFYYKFKLVKIPKVRSKALDIFSLFYVENTLGKLPYTAKDI
jgi:glycosyltransferase involved in cell wall biosynthesis